MGELVPLLNVEDVAKSLAFYETALGAQVENHWELDGRVRWARIRFESGSLMLNTPDEVSSRERRSRSEFSDVVLYVTCDDVRVLRDELDRVGLPVGPVSSEAYGSREFSLRDPDGYAIRFSSPL